MANWYESGRKHLHPTPPEWEAPRDFSTTVNGLDECILDESGQLSPDYDGVRHVVFDPATSDAVLLQNQAPTSSQVELNDQTWRDFTHETNGLTPSDSERGSGPHLEACGAHRNGQTQVYLYQNHRRLTNFYEPQLHQEQYGYTAVRNDLSIQEAEWFTSRLPRGMFALSRPDPRNENRRTLYMPHPDQGMGPLQTVEPLDELLSSEGGFSERGCHVWTHYAKWYNPTTWFHPVSIPESWFFRDDARTCALHQSLETYLKPMRDRRSAQADNIATVVGSSIMGALAMGYLFVEGIRDGINSRVKNVGLWAVNGARRLFGQKSIQRNYMGEFNGKLHTKMASVSELAREYLRNPEAFRAKYPGGIPTMNVPFPELDDLPARLEDDPDYEDMMNIKRAMERGEDASAWLIGPQGDGKTFTAVKFIVRAARGDFGEEWARTDFWTLNHQIVEGQKGDYSSGTKGGTTRFVTDMNDAMERNFNNGRPVVLMADEMYGLKQAGLYLDHHTGQELNPSIIDAFRTKAAGSRVVRILGTTITRKFEELAKQHEDFFGPQGRGQRIDRQPKTREQTLTALRSKANLLQSELEVEIKDDVLEQVARYSFEELGLYNIRAAKNLLNNVVRDVRDHVPYGPRPAAGWPVTVDDVNRIAEEEAQAREARVVADSFAGEDGMGQRVGDLEQRVINKVVSEQYADFPRWETDVRGRVMRGLVAVWEGNPIVQARYRRMDAGRGFEMFVRNAIKNERVKEALDNGQARFGAIDVMDQEETTQARGAVEVELRAQLGTEVDAADPASLRSVVDQLIGTWKTRQGAQSSMDAAAFTRDVLARNLAQVRQMLKAPPPSGATPPVRPSVAASTAPGPQCSPEVEAIKNELRARFGAEFPRATEQVWLDIANQLNDIRQARSAGGGMDVTQFVTAVMEPMADQIRRALASRVQANGASRGNGAAAAGAGARPSAERAVVERVIADEFPDIAASPPEIRDQVIETLVRMHTLTFQISGESPDEVARSQARSVFQRLGGAAPATANPASSTPPPVVAPSGAPGNGAGTGGSNGAGRTNGTAAVPPAAPPLSPARMQQVARLRIALELQHRFPREFGGRGNFVKAFGVARGILTDQGWTRSPVNGSVLDGLPPDDVVRRHVETYLERTIPDQAARDAWFGARGNDLGGRGERGSRFVEDHIRHGEGELGVAAEVLEQAEATASHGAP